MGKRYRFSKMLCIFVFLFLFPGMTQAYITVGGDQSGTWMTDSTYYISTDVTVPSGSTLTIPKGVKVKFNQHTSLNVFGTLLVDGSLGLVYFTSKNDNSVGQIVPGSTGSPYRSDWYWITFSGSGANNSVLDSCVVKYASKGVTIASSSPEIRNSTFRDNWYGIECSNGNPTLSNNLVTFNAAYGIYLNGSSSVISNCKILNNGSLGTYTGLYGTSSSPTIQTCVIKNNTGGGIYIDGATNPVTISGNEVSNNDTSGSSYGIYYLGTAQATISYNYVSGHGGYYSIGIITSHAQVNNNIITSNWFPLAVTNHVNSTYSGNTITGNWYNTVMGVVFGNLSGTLYNPSNLPPPLTMNQIIGIPNTSLPRVENGDSLTIQPGARISGLTLVVNGTLSAIGKADSLIRFTTSLLISGSGASSSVLDFCVLDTGYINISDCDPVVRNSSIMHSGSDGILCTNSNAILSGNLITANRLNGISLINSSPVISNCRITNNSLSGTGYSGIFGTNSSPTIQDCVIENARGYGVFVTGANDPTTITGDTILGNSSAYYGIVTSFAQVNNNIITGYKFPFAATGNLNNTSYWGNTMTGNTYNTAMVVFGNISGTLYNPYNLPFPLTSNVITTTTTIIKGESLTVQPGAVIKFLVGQYLTIKGTLRAVGKTDSLIAFTSFKDDSLGGDSNSDGGDSLPAPRDWAGLSILDSSSSNSVFDFCIIRYAEQCFWINSSNPVIRNSVISNHWIGINMNASNSTFTNDLITSCTAGGIYISGNPSPYIYKCDVSANGTSGSYCGIYSFWNASPRIRRSNILNNTDGAVRSTSGSSPVIDSCNIYGNTNYGVNNEDVAITLNAQYNWWGDSTGPRDTSIKPPDYNPGGLGDKVSDYVNYRPWLTRPYICADANGDEKVTVADIVFLVSYVFKHGPAPVPLKKGDANGDGIVNIADIVYLVAYIFKHGALPRC